MKFHLIIQIFLALSAIGKAAPVLNEIHYNNDLNSICNEFVELHNPGAEDVNLSGWQLTGAVEFIFPAGTVLPASGYLVVGEDPATLSGEFGITALGPYSGNLNSEGESLELVDASDVTVDVVDYGVGFPWPSLAAGDGSSMELINPNLDNDLGSSWRSSSMGSEAPPRVLIPIGSDWRYREGLNEASDPIDAWTANGFFEDATWLDGQAPFGRGEPALTNTTINGIFRNYSSVFLRKEFTFNGETPSTLILRTLYDDGVIIWLNGTEIFRSESVDPGTIDYRGNDGNNAGAEAHGTAVSSDEQDGYEEFTIEGTAELLQSGLNVLAVQVFNDSIGSSDFLVDASLETPEPIFEQSPPSPGEPNGVSAVSTPPNIRQVGHFPLSPTSADPVTVRARVTDPDGVAEVILSYQIVAPGSYIRRSDPDYELGWIELPMSDTEDDGNFTAVIPASSHRDLVRYRITSADGSETAVRAPFLDDNQPNFAFFVYDGVPEWTGANQPGTDAAATFSRDLLNKLPTYHLIANATDVTNSQYVTAFNNVRFFGTLVYDGEVYDHIEFEVGGTGSTYLSGKNKWRIYFNPARDIEVRDNYGRRYEESWNKLTMNSCASTRAAGHRGIAGMDESLSFRVHQLAGSLSPNTSYLHFRVIDDAVETSPTDQYNGDLWGLYLAIEEIDGALLDTRDLPDGNIYRIENGDRENRAKGQPTDSSDWSLFSSLSARTNTEDWWRENLDLERYFNFRASNRVVGNVDLRYTGNHFFYHGSNEDGTQSRWAPIVWDCDMMFLAISHQRGTVRQENCLSHSAIALEYRNRCRELLDLLVDDASADGGQIGQLIDEFTQILNPPDEVLTWSDLDQFLWNFNPRSGTDSRARFDHFGNFFVSPYTESRAGGTWTRTLESQDFEGQMDFIRNYMTDTDPDPASWTINSGDQQGYAYNFLVSEALDLAIPETPTISYSGEAGFPANALNFESTTFADPQGSGTMAAIEWRIGELDASPGEARTYEIEELWTSLIRSPATLSVSPPASPLEVGNTYRARVRHQDTTGRWSHWSAPLEFVVGDSDVSTLQESLIVSEIMYNPATEQDHEYIEVHNIGASLLDLTGVRFTDGISFEFPSGTALAPGAYLLVVRNLAAFAAQYGNSLPIAGSYGESDSGSLSNGGEGIELSLGTTVIHNFSYNDNSPWPLAPDGGGSSLVLYQTSADLSLDLLDPLGHGRAEHWRQSVSGGSPGAADPREAFAGDAAEDNDNDGLTALLEYAIGSSDLDPTGSGFEVGFDGGRLTLTFPRNPLASDIQYLVEVSADLQAWSEDAVLESQDASTATYVFEPEAGRNQRYFIRLRVEQVPALQQSQ